MSRKREEGRWSSTVLENDLAHSNGKKGMPYIPLAIYPHDTARSTCLLLSPNNLPLLLPARLQPE
ncbi:ORF1038 [White spot syndrome virus]|uniref:ORF1038 n=1 Tax=White spot syndrome virus TaxID=342409 RepID=A0A2D3I6U9_9VIRU|nr:ORF1038 [White spot syndrome virus]